MSPTHPPTLTSAPPASKTTLISFPTPQILLVTINRPHAMNSIATAGHHDLSQIWHWYDTEPSLRCAIVTGASGGKKPAFCAGQDLKEWNASQTTAPETSRNAPGPSHPEGGFGGLSQRTGKKPIIAAVDGLALGGGLEMLANTDIVIATPRSTFGLPEAQVGVAAFAGVLPRLAMSIGLQRASEIALAGRVLGAEEAERWGLVNRVVGEGEDVVAAAVKMAGKVCRASPDSVIVTRAGLRSAWYMGGGVDEAVKGVWDGVGRGLQEGENIKEGLKAFVERREPKWRDSKL